MLWVRSARVRVFILVMLALTQRMPAESMPRPSIIAHRGASGYLPEHTIAAKAAAYAMGADFLEQDLVLSKDGIPVVLHDIHLDTTTDVGQKFPDRHRADGRYYAIDFTLAELRQLHATERFNLKTRKAVFPKRFPIWQGSFELHTFEEELQLIQGLNRSTGRGVGIYPEIKAPAWHRGEGQDISRIVLEILHRYGYRSKPDNCFLQCFEWDEVKRLRTELGYGGRLILLLGDDAAGRLHCTPAGLAEVAKIADGIGPAMSLVVGSAVDRPYRITDLVAQAHAAKLLVHPYTLRADELPKFVTSFEALCRIVFTEAQVDGAFTDFTDRAVAFMKTGLSMKEPGTVRPLLHAHAHNDYEHPHPLRDALAQGFCSVEADIWLVEGQLLVAHDRAAVKPGRTLQSLYLAPLRERIQRNGGKVYAGVPTCTLLIDVKSEAAATYEILREVLQGYADILAEYTSSNSPPRALSVILTGNSATDLMTAEPVRYAAIDGRLSDLGSSASSQLIPLISDNWKQYFGWRGDGPLPEDERVKLQRFVQRAHEQGRRIRFWGAPDSMTGWRELQSAGVDLIGTDNLEGLGDFLRSVAGEDISRELKN